MRAVAMVVISLAIVLSQPARAALSVFTTVPEWGALTQEIGGEHVKVFTATHALQDPHRIEARPALIARARQADLVVATGADLEAGWLPLVLREAGNARIQPMGAGYFEAARHVALLEVPPRPDRADGDVHAAGNPHIQTDPRNILRVAEALAGTLAQRDAANATAYRAAFAAFASRWQANIARWEKAAVGLRGQPVVVQHKSLSYLVRWLGLREVATLEPRPGVEASVGQLGELLQRTGRHGGAADPAGAPNPAGPPRMVLRAAWEAPRAAQWFARESGAALIVLPFTVGGNAAAHDLTTLFDDTVARLAGAVK